MLMFLAAFWHEFFAETGNMLVLIVVYEGLK